MSPAEAPLTLVTLSTNFTSDGNHNFSCSDKTLVFWLWGTIGTPCGFVGLPASVWLLWVLVQRQRNGMSDNYMLNLTIMNLIINVVIALNILNSITLRDEGLLRAASIIYVCCTTGQPLMMAFICVDCYIAVVHPVTYMKLKHSSYRLGINGLVWILLFICGISLNLNGETISPFRLAPYILTLPTIVYCDLYVLHVLRRPDPSGRTSVHPQKQRALQIITISLIVTVVAFLPPLVVLLSLMSKDKGCSRTDIIVLAPLVGCTIMSLLNLYHMGVQNSFKRVLCVLKYFK